jgi:hypothetical protein
VPKALPLELSFIDKFRLNHHSLEHAAWRKNAFSDDIWKCEFGSVTRTIDFNKVLDDGTVLTDRKNQALLDSIKRFLCLQTHPALTGAVINNATTEASRVMLALHVLDYFLLRSEQFGMGEHGFALVTANDVITFLDTLTTNRRPKECVYEPLSHIAKHLQKVSVAAEDLNRLEGIAPYLFELEDGAEMLLSPQQTVIARAWLKLNDFYIPGTDAQVTEYRFRVSRERLLNTLIGDKALAPLRFMGLDLPGLDLAPSQTFSRELPAVPVNNLDDDDRASLEFASAYITVLKSMQVARQQGFPLLSEAALVGLESAALLLQERTKERARFTTLPFSLANQLLSNAIAFYFEYSEPLVTYYLDLARCGKDPKELAVQMPTELLQLGVMSWRSTASTATEFFTQMRAGTSLFNMLEVLWGSIAIIVGTLTARRVSELEDLTAASIVEDKGLFFIALDLRKANVRDHRQRVLRPMPGIAADVLKLLRRVSSTLQELGYKTGGKLFEVPYSAWHGNPPYFGTVLPDLNRCFDRFSDYHQTGLDDLGRRYYVRTHQLRRNFAMLFFWSGSFGGIEVLRYFLGHSKPSMTYRYITEAVSGKVLRRVKAGVAKDLVRRDDAAVTALSELLCERYGLTLNDLHILPERDVIDYIEDVMVSGEAEIEPEFFNGPKGEEYRFVYKVKRRESSRDV